MDEGEIVAAEDVRGAVSGHLAEELQRQGRPRALAEDDEITAILQLVHDKLIQNEDQIALGVNEKKEMIFPNSLSLYTTCTNLIKINSKLNEIKDLYCSCIFLKETELHLSYYCQFLSSSGKNHSSTSFLSSKGSYFRRSACREVALHDQQYGLRWSSKACYRGTLAKSRLPSA